MIKKFNIISSELYFTAFLLLIISVAGCDKEVSRSPVESEAPKGFIYINSDPPGFTIFQNGRNTGRLTPDSISYIEEGAYEITLKKKYFKDTSLTVMLSENEKLQVYFDILSNPSMYGNLYLKTIPEGVAITINDSALNKVTPVYLENLLPGEYNIKYDLFNYRSLEFIGVVQSSDSTSYTKELRDTSVWVDYQVTNSDIPSNLLYPIAIDDNNIKWIGTVNKGLIKYDEVNFINYNTSNSQIPSNRVNCIAIDDQNRVWVGTNNGIGIFNGSSWIVYNQNNSGLTNTHINKIRFNGNGTVWIATAGNLVNFDGIN
ncbi:MAG: PEGA domain-containing protein, partial [Ignavibacteriaceae bacterium]|nr:PEGA domain-containing protein [Ignavibacteriaceae bacterium]